MQVPAFQLHFCESVDTGCHDTFSVLSPLFAIENLVVAGSIWGVLCWEDSLVRIVLCDHAQHCITLLLVGESHVWTEGHPVHPASVNPQTLHK